jgi:DNA-binding Lrp family transcriptional regulator
MGRDTAVTSRLDEIDRQILRELQADGRMTNVELARRVGMSAPPCLRRVRTLEETGVLRGYRGLVDEKAVGFGIVWFAFVHLASQAAPDLEAFEARIRAWPEVRECWTLSGDIDFILKCVARDLAHFQSLVTELTDLPHIRTVRTAVTLERIKDEPIAPI